MELSNEPKVAPASAVDEAARMYPDKYINGEGWANGSHYMDYEIAKLQRSAHITCAGMYTGEIERLKAENSKMRNALDRLTDENNKLAGENHMQSEELGELKNITEGLPARIMNQQSDLLIAYRNKIALTPDATVESILEMLEDDIKTLRTMDGGEIIKNIKK